MILSKSDLQRYLELDRRALGIRRAKRPPLTGYRVWKFQVALRKHEYYANTGRSLFGRIMKKFWLCRALALIRPGRFARLLFRFRFPPSTAMC